MSPLLTDRTKVAVPYYGSLLHPVYGLSHLFYVGLIDESGTMLSDLEIAVWNPEDTTELAAWLRANHISGLLTTDHPEPYVTILFQKGIWVEGNLRGGPRELISQWLLRQVNRQTGEFGLVSENG